MAQITSGLRAVLSAPAVYDLFENLVGAARCRSVLVREFARPAGGERVLDVGCGTAAILAHLPDVDYCGYDISARYIDAARTRYGGRGRFVAALLTEASLADERPFDLVLAVGLLHHLDDDEVRQLLRLCRAALARHGRLVTLDPCFDHSQSAIARWIVAHDRGQNVRTLDAYRQLALEVFPDTRASLRNDLLRIPYTHAICECRG
ncbi:MAG: class I SAM-dependent methyltransferase [Burkholderiales bacterium]|nr:class I SAM-dependent methyltransferase [Burkholderiales bacterium]